MGRDQGEHNRSYGAILTPQLCTGLNDGKIVASEIGATIPGVTSDTVELFLLELTSAVAQGELKIEKFPTALKAAGSVTEGCGCMLVDVIWCMWQQCEVHKQDSRRQLLGELLKKLLAEQVVDRNLLLRLCDCEMLQESGLIVAADAFRKKEIRVHTKHVYAQHKYNLLREDSEGFSALLLTLSAFKADFDVKQTRERIVSLIGYYELDPHRVADLVLDAWEMSPHNDAFLNLLDMFNAEAVTQLLGNKLQQHQRAEGWPTSRNLYIVAAKLVKAGVLAGGVCALMAHLAPEDAALKKSWKEGVEQLTSAVKQIGVVNLTASVQQKDREKDEASGSSAWRDLDARPLRRHLADAIHHNNQKVGIVEGFLSVDDWESAREVLSWLHNLGVVAAAVDSVALALCGALRRTLEEPLAQLKLYGGWGSSTTDEPPGGELPALSLPPSAWDMMRYLGMYLFHDPPLAALVARLLRHIVLHALSQTGQADHLAHDLAKGQLTLAEEMLSAVLLPCSMMCPANPALITELWAVMKELPYTTRFRLYAQLRESYKDSTDNLLLLASAKLADVEVRRVLRRIHVPADKKDKKEYLKPHGRKFGKICHANPLEVMKVVINQVENYSKMTEPIIDALRFVHPAAFDVLTFLIVDKLASATKKLKEDGVNIADWLQSLAVFTGQVCKKYVNLELHALCQYVANQLRQCRSMDLLLLKELVATMAGILNIDDLSEAQVDALAGGKLLRQETITLSTTPSVKAQQKGSARLMAALQEVPPHERLAVPLLVLISQQRNILVTKPDTMYLKLLTTLYDKCHETLIQYIDFLTSALAPDAYEGLMPSLTQLKDDYSLDPQVIFQVHRPIIRRLSAPAPVLVEDGEIEEGQAMEEDGPPGVAANGDAGTADVLTWPDVVQSVRNLLPESTWEGLSVEFYIMFWTLTYEDIHVPTQRYTSEISRLHAALRGKENAVYEARDPQNRDNVVDEEQLKKEVAKIEATLRQLPIELEAQQRNYQAVSARLEEEKGSWLMGVSNHHLTAIVFLQHCILPRVLYSPQDAIYCSRIIQRLHSMDTPYFPSILVYDRMLKELIHVIFCLTDREAVNFGIFLADTMRQLEVWRCDSAVYESECASRCGFALDPSKPSARRTNYDEFRKINFKWQNKVAIVFRACLQSSEYVQIRNTLLVMNKIVKVFPVLSTVFNIMDQVVQKLMDEEEREDLKTLARSYLTALRAEGQKPDRFQSKEVYGGNPNKVTTNLSSMARTTTSAGGTSLREAEPSVGPAQEEHKRAHEPSVSPSTSKLATEHAHRAGVDGSRGGGDDPDVRRGIDGGGRGVEDGVDGTGVHGDGRGDGGRVAGRGGDVRGDRAGSMRGGHRNPLNPDAAAFVPPVHQRAEGSQDGVRPSKRYKPDAEGGVVVGRSPLRQGDDRDRDGRESRHEREREKEHRKDRDKDAPRDTENERRGGDGNAPPKRKRDRDDESDRGTHKRGRDVEAEGVVEGMEEGERSAVARDERERGARGSSRGKSNEQRGDKPVNVVEGMRVKDEAKREESGRRKEGADKKADRARSNDKTKEQPKRKSNR